MTAALTAGASIVLPGFYADVAPKAATPSSPAVGELVAVVTRLHAGAWYVYADGRLISVEDGHLASGWVEQRLTVEGVERVHAEVLATGLFDADRSPGPVVADQVPFPTLQVRDSGGRLLTARLDRLDRGPNLEVDQLVRYFWALDSSLPEDMWLDRQGKSYVSSRYEFCVARMSKTSTHDALPDPSMALTLLPPGPAAMLAGRPTAPQPWTGGPTSCFEVTRDEAQSLADELGRTGAIAVTSPEPMIVSFSITPLLPHGTPAAWGG
jgi:hypothetical protein